MGINIVFETHSITEDNERGIATGWHHGRLYPEGRRLARELGNRRRNNGIHTIFTSDLRRAVETVEIALGDTTIPLLQDWRLRECDYGDQNGMPTTELHSNRRQYLDKPYPNGESWHQAIQRVGHFLENLHLRWENKRVLVVGHVATRWAFEHYLDHMALEDLMEAVLLWHNPSYARNRDCILDISSVDRLLEEENRARPSKDRPCHGICFCSHWLMELDH